MKKTISRILCLASIFSLFGCAPSSNSSINSSLNNNDVTLEEIENVSKNLVKVYETKETLNLTTNNLSLSAIARYNQTIHVEEYGIVFDKCNASVEIGDLKNDKIKLLSNLDGDFNVYTLVTNRGKKDEEESKDYKFKLNNEKIYLDKTSVYASFSKDLYGKILGDDENNEGIKIYKPLSLGDIKFDNQNTNIDIFNPSSFINPSKLLNDITTKALLKKYLKLEKKNNVYNVSISLKQSDLYTLINDYMNSYASQIELPDEANFSISFSFIENEIISLDIDSNINAKVKFDSLGNVDFKYLANGSMKYSDDISNLNSFVKNDDYIEYDENNIPIKKFMDESFSDIKAIYDQIAALFTK